MQESLRSIGKVPPPRISDKLEDIYSDEAHHFREEEHLRKRLFSQIIQKSDERIRQKQQLEKELERRENQEIDLFWRVIIKSIRTKNSADISFHANANER